MTTPTARAAALLFTALLAMAAAAAPQLYTVVSDTLDANAPVATLPSGPVLQSLMALTRDQPQAKLLVLPQSGERNGLRYTLAAWQNAPGTMAWDALLVVATPAGARTVEISSTHDDRAAVLEALIAYGTTGTPPVVPAKPAAVPAVAASASPQGGAAAAALLPMPTAWDQRFVVLYAANPGYRPGTTAAEAALTEQHLQYTLRLQRDGKALAAGPFAASGVAADGVVGMTLLRVRDLAAAERVAAADPAVMAGRLIATVRAWTVPAGKLP